MAIPIVTYLILGLSGGYGYWSAQKRPRHKAIARSIAGMIDDRRESRIAAGTRPPPLLTTKN